MANGRENLFDEEAPNRGSGLALELGQGVCADRVHHRRQRGWAVGSFGSGVEL